MKFFYIIIFILLGSLIADCPEDFNNDGVANVVDIIYLVNFVLYDSCSESNDDGGLCDDQDQDGICDDVDNCVGQIDNCNVCNGNNACLTSALANANLILENILVNLYSSESIDHPSEIDFTPAYDSYMYCLSIDPNNPNANFGAALTGFLTVSQDSILWEVFDEWNNYNGWLIPEDDDGFNSTANMAGYGLPINNSDFLSPLKVDILNYIPINQLMDFAMQDELTFEFPSLIEFQDMIDNVFIDRLTHSIESLDKVVGKNYTFTITPQMQNDEYQTSLEMDDTEFYALKSSMHLLRALLSSINTYSFEGIDLSSQFSGDYSWLEVGSEFLTIREAASNYLPRVHDDLNSIISSIENAYYFCQNESDYQGNDIILWQEIYYDNFQNDIDVSRDILNSNYVAELCNDNYCTDVDINLNSFLNNPPQDLKTMIPDYHIVTQVDDYEWWDGSGWTNQNINPATDCSDFESEEFCSGNESEGYFCSWDSNQNTCNGDVYQCYENKLDCNIQYDNGYYDYISNECYANEDLYAFAMEAVDSYLAFGGSNYVYVWIDYWNLDCTDCDEIDWYYGGSYNCEDNVRVSFEFQGAGQDPCLIFDSSSYSNWVNDWDITFNGLFPTISSYTFFNDIIDVDQEEWYEIQSCD